MLSIIKNKRGVSAIVVAMSIVMLIGFAAIAVDVFHLTVVKNELQNAADAGALEGAGTLYRASLGDYVDRNANEYAYDAAVANQSEGVAVELYNYDGFTYNTCPTPEPAINNSAYEDVQRGHWAFANPSGSPAVADSYFKCNNSTTAVNLTDHTWDYWNADDNFINAVKVTTRREGRVLGTPVLSFFSKIFTNAPITMSAQAIGYIGFSELNIEIGAPIAVCRESIANWSDPEEGPIECNEGRMYNANNDTARWTSTENCDGNTNAANVRPLIAQTCDPNQANPIVDETFISTQEGQINSAFDDLVNCWLTSYNEIVKTGVDLIPEGGDGEDDTEIIPLDTNSDSIPDTPWAMTLPVIICEGDDAAGPTCGPVDGAVKIEVVWMAMKDDIDETNPTEPGAPDYMHYDIPSWNGTEFVDSNSWPGDWPDEYVADGGYWVVTNPKDNPGAEPIHDPNMGDEASVYDILDANLSDPQLAQLKSDILSDHPGWDLVNWIDSEGTPLTLEELMDYGEVRWASFVKHFKLKKEDKTSPAVYVKKTMYFMPVCERSPPTGNTGLNNWGVLAKYPKLVK
jgi:hypothetical protein